MNQVLSGIKVRVCCSRFRYVVVGDGGVDVDDSGGGSDSVSLTAVSDAQRHLAEGNERRFERHEGKGLL